MIISCYICLYKIKTDYTDYTWLYMIVNEIIYDYIWLYLFIKD